MEGADCKWVAHVRHCNGINGAERPIGILSIRLVWKRCDKVASSGAPRRHSSPSPRGVALEQVAIRAHGNSVVEVGALESERSASLYNAGDNTIRCDQMTSVPIVALDA